MLNKENAKALFAGAKDGTTLILPHEERLGIMTDIVDKMLLRELATLQQPFGDNAGGYDFIKVAKSSLVEKTEPGVTLKDKGKHDIVSIKWNKPKHGGRVYMLADLKMGVPELSAFHLLKFADDFKKTTEKEGFKYIEDYVENTAHNLNVSNIVSLNEQDRQIKNFVQKLIHKATELTQYVDDEDNINLIDKDNIVIFVAPDIMDQIAMMSMIGNRVDQSFLGGQFSFQTFFGYKIFACPYLNKWKAMVATNFCLATAFRFLNGKVGTIGNTQDIEIVFEAQNLFGLLYPKTVFGFKYTN